MLSNMSTGSHTDKFTKLSYNEKTYLAPQRDKNKES